MIMKISLLLALLALGSVYALENGLARKPPMGWNSWNHFGCDLKTLNESAIKGIADAMVSSGMAAVGYEYVNIDDCWPSKERDARGRLQSDPIRFPSGIKALADYVHSRGLKFGIYEDSGKETCGGYPGMQGFYDLDLKTFEEWGVDYVKVDGCGTKEKNYVPAYTNMSKIIAALKRPMVYSCSYPAYIPEETDYYYVGTICNLWREYDDITDNFKAWTNILDYQIAKKLAPFAGPGHWNDPDMLEVGNGAQTSAEYRAHFSLWAILAAPLIAGNDLRSMSDDTISILTAVEVIAVDQDPLGQQGTRVSPSGLLEVYARTLFDDSRAVVLFNRGNTTAQITCPWTLLGWNTETVANVRDLWQRKNLGSFHGSFAASVESHAAVMVRVTPQK